MATSCDRRVGPVWSARPPSGPTSAPQVPSGLSASARRRGGQRPSWLSRRRPQAPAAARVLQTRPFASNRLSRLRHCPAAVPSPWQRPDAARHPRALKVGFVHRMRRLIRLGVLWGWGQLCFRAGRLGSLADPLGRHELPTGLAGALGGADQRPAPRAPGQNQRPAPRAPERPRFRQGVTIPG